MRMKFGGGIGVLASMMMGLGAAGAADLAMKGPAYKAPPPAYLSDWGGFYIGVHGGYGWSNSSFGQRNEDELFVDTNFKQKGGLFGGHAGYNWQYGMVVTGIEVDFDGADIKGDGVFFDGFHVTAKTDELASARARLGYLVSPDLLAYGTAGAGLAHTTMSCFQCLDGGVSQFGWVAGAGLEYKFYGNWIARAEYLHYDFKRGDEDFVFGSTYKESIDVVRGGVSYKF